MTTLRGPVNSLLAPRSLWQNLALLRPQEGQERPGQPGAGDQEIRRSGAAPDPTPGHHKNSCQLNFPPRICSFIAEKVL